MDSLPASIPHGDVLVIAGDTLSLDHRVEAQREELESQLAPFLAELPHERILLIAGNHDFLFADPQAWQEGLPANVTYLLDEAVEVGGIRFWGTPWSTLLPGWAFMEPEAKLPSRWAAIPPETDVLVVHGPPFGSLDRTRAEIRGRARRLAEPARLDRAAPAGGRDLRPHPRRLRRRPDRLDGRLQRLVPRCELRAHP